MSHVMREIIFDTETTGLDPKTGDRMVEIGCIEMVNRVATGRTFHAYFNPDRDMPAAAEAVHGLSITFLSDKPRFHERAAELLEFVGDSPLVAHNAGFDFGFLNTELEMCGLDPVDRGRMIDTVALARVRHPGAKLSLDALCTRYGIDRSHRTLHGALLDAELLAQVYVELTGGRQIGLHLAEETVDTIVAAAVTLTVRERPLRPARPHRPSEAELAAHAAFLETVKAPLWLS
ncbi:DNA polymerase III subunit epsilon [Novosphingobium kunmingense]|uniref:DNA polymerase III subunit epsilon n=1 Tax=Novosphingobium kunmingense TaxID=1211806 RepID=UPI0022B7F0FE|nr:DNA polymerase III subunit epsilon [Novosphingobium kunmingense]